MSSPPADLSEIAFRFSWHGLERRGLCDSVGGAEYQRILAAWRAAGQPRWIASFIAAHANTSPNKEQHK